MLKIEENIILAPQTVFKVGGAARYFSVVESVDDLCKAALWAKERSTPFVVLGAGSNVLVDDNGFAGLVIKLALREIRQDGFLIHAQAGAAMAAVTYYALQRGLSGFEWAVGIPGTIGGSVVGNAGCYGSEMNDVIESVSIFNALSGQRYSISNKGCLFSYRHSAFKAHPEWVIVGATLKLFHGSADESQRSIFRYMKARTATQDIGTSCAGCVFKNPSKDIAAGFLIDTVGLKGTNIGKAAVSQHHANFIVNTGGATSEEIKKLITVIKKTVKEKHGTILEEEIRMIG